MKKGHMDMPWHSREVIDHQFPLTEDGKLELAETMANARAEVLRLESELADLKKNYKEQIDMFSGQFSQAALRFRSGLAEAVEVECDVYQDFAREEMVYVSVSDREEIMRRQMRPREKMPSLFSTPEEGGATISKFSDREIL